MYGTFPLHLELRNRKEDTMFKMIMKNKLEEQFKYMYFLLCERNYVIYIACPYLYYIDICPDP